ncbi:hypothetical protein VMT65_16370 [Nocardia sp. CDC153]|uniref:hypothetical protein n=1 Tax=Nocardia sp. CDC153 TaxID=3112167 RepID=UPI002DBA114C|nr:hypothetical protein [Nocardia sp. CDC153]MEC3954616.1 hypothetical protein [Nocardia sp. CDC153]
MPTTPTEPTTAPPGHVALTEYDVSRERAVGDRPTAPRARATSGGRRLGRMVTAPMAIAALAVGGVPVAASADAAEAEDRRARVSSGCLWAGKTYAPGDTVAAGGTSFRCGTEAAMPYWFATAPTNQPDTVPTPGAIASPVGQFSPGARQPGTSYTDYCVGNQLIPGTDDVYQVVRVSGGKLLWKAAHPIANWKFSGPPPEPTWRTPALCIDGILT